MVGLFKRGKKYYALYYAGNSKKRKSLNTESYQIAKEKLRKIESSLFKGDDVPLPTKTPVEKIINDYVEHIRTYKTPKSAQTDVYYLRQTFGVICEALEITSRKPTKKARKKKLKEGVEKMILDKKFLKGAFMSKSIVGDLINFRGLVYAPLIFRRNSMDFNP